MGNNLLDGTKMR